MVASTRPAVAAAAWSANDTTGRDGRCGGAGGGRPKVVAILTRPRWSWVGVDRRVMSAASSTVSGCRRPATRNVADHAEIVCDETRYRVAMSSRDPAGSPLKPWYSSIARARTVPSGPNTR